MLMKPTWTAKSVVMRATTEGRGPLCIAADVPC